MNRRTPLVAVSILAALARAGLADDPAGVRALPCRDLHTLALAFSPDGRMLATGGRTTRSQPVPVRLWDVATGRERATLTGHRANI